MDTDQTFQGNDELKVIVLCENCLQKLRLPIPAPKKKLHVTCPKCKYKFVFRYDPLDLRHYEHEHLRLAIIHQESNLTKYEQPIIGPTRTTYQYRRSDPFFWEIARPKTGNEKFSLICPHCGKQLEVGLVSFEKMAKEKAKWRNVKKIRQPISAFIFFLSIAIIFASVKAPALMGNASYLGLLVFPGLITFFAVQSEMSNPLGGYTNIEMKSINVTRGGHYFAHIESH